MDQSVSGPWRQPSGGRRTPWPPDSLLGGLDEADLEPMLRLGSPCRYPAEAALMRQGEWDTYVVLLRSGKVKVSAASEKGDLTLLAIRVPGDVVGDLAALRCGPRSASVIACTQVMGNKITQDEFQAFLAGHPAVALALARMVGRRLVGANERRVEYASYPVKVRLARVLTEFGGQHGQRTSHGIQIDVKLTQPELAGLTGAKNSAIQKAFRELREEGLVDTVHGRITILRPARLERGARYSAARTLT